MNTKYIIGIVLAGLLFTVPMQAQKQTAPAEKTEALTQSVKPRHLTKAEFLSKVANFEKTPDRWEYLGARPCIVDFYASWCGPCKMLAPIIEELGEEYAGRVDIYKVDVDEQQELAALFGVRSIPTLLFIPRDGKPQLAQGAMPRAELRRLIDQLLLGGK